MADGRVYDFLVIGGGIVGLSCAMQLAERHPGAAIAVVEKEAALASHQTGHNSGVIHAGVYYEPGSLKARFCAAGVDATIAFCRRHKLPFEQCGKLLVATNALELERMDGLEARCRQNGLSPIRLSAGELTDREPAITGLGALLVERTGIADYRAIALAMADEIRARGGEIHLETGVLAIHEADDAVTVETSQGPLRTRMLVVCAGLQADRLARMAGIKTDFRIVPFRGEFYKLAPARGRIIDHLIYPIPDPALPFVGVHLTRMIDGSIKIGPNAVLARAREGYGKADISLRDLGDTLRYPGFWKLAGRHWKSGITEMRNSLSRAAYLELARKYCPSLTLDDLLPYEAGIRAQVVMEDGSMQNDFMLRETKRMLHVCCAPSPAATSAIPIGAHVADRVGARDLNPA
ncbi:L-2-hydroxyglutarate oxidase [Amorphus coralli]|uniref:L-2-hydroxyglutarate oxidase n=1 Tax=Amorphus coralli TaxID=340680 RepID=UPI0003744BD9|nr:L-2-hydroxyglutarate oxidase [Amorphus coralli]